MELKLTEEPQNIDFAECLRVILSDVSSVYPVDQLEFVRDSKRIAQQSARRGLPFFTMDLPELGKAFDASLSSGRLNLNHLPHSKGKKKESSIPKLFSGLWKRIFDTDGLLLKDADADAIFFLRQLLYVGKKVTLDCPPRYLYQATKEFFHVEAILPSLPSLWDSHDTISRDTCGDLRDLLHTHEGSIRDLPGVASDDVKPTPILLETVQRVADRIASSFGLIHPEELIPRHGPGVVSDRKGSFDKFEFLYWSESLQELFPYDTFGILNMSEGLEDSQPTGYPIFRDWHSKLVAVPKTQKGPRLIAAEPQSNQWIQQAIARWTRWKSRDTLVRNMVDFFDQNPSREAALDASYSGLRSTIDLKSASDRLTCWLVQRMFRSNPGYLEMLRASRTKYMRNDVDAKQPSLIKLRKFATQGSAMTFPLQSIIFSTLCLGVGKYLHPRRGLRALSKEVRVFGDDIIVPNSWVPTLVSLLEALALKVNTVKTHTKGNFRESCGMDAWRGHDVTPAYITSLQTNALDARLLQGAIDTQNHFYLKGLWRTASHLTRTVRQVNKFPVVRQGARVPGLVTFTKKGSNNAGSYPVRLNRSLQRMEIRLPTFRGRSSQGLSRRFGVFPALLRQAERDLSLGRRVGLYELSQTYAWIFQSIQQGWDPHSAGDPRQKAGSEAFLRNEAAAVVRDCWVDVSGVDETLTYALGSY